MQESVYPPFYSWGAPRRHHAVVYFHVPVAGRASAEMDREMALQREEVDAAAWLSARHAAIVVRGKHGGPKGFYAGNYAGWVWWSRTRLD